MLLNFINSSKKLLNIPHHQNEEKNLNLLETFSKYFGAQHIKALVWFQNRTCDFPSQKAWACFKCLRRSTEENHGTTFVFHYTIRDNVESQNMRLLEQDDVLQRDFRQITESTETIFPFLKVSNSYYHTPTYILNLLFSVKKKQKQKKLKTTLALHTYLTRIPLYITDFFLWKLSPLPAFLVNGEQLTLRKLSCCRGSLHSGGNGVFIAT